MAKKSKSSDKSVQKVFMVLAALVSVALFVIGGLAFWAHSFTTTMVREELSAQKIYFPKAGAPNFSEEDYPDLQKYAGQLVDNAEKAKAYANGYIGAHIKDTADGKTYSEVSTLARQNPDDETLQQQRETLLQGETLRGILLGTGYAFGTVGMIAGIAAWVLFGLGAALAVIAVYFAKKYYS